ncbi:SAF domain protein [Geobacillus kaustophilus GBlys]|uniref:SAF domain protein n=1 Tax=Geobacillus kaustophilus GBlys TaxID=1337888 RepID=U2YE21_GEOKU|nr:AAA family ATPase [Geobacillus kaustophilus]GAD15388.1 SAF domain protein [Geobacillus kaustophilus GBlys]
MSDKRIIAFYSNSHNVGKRTISQAFAYRLAKEGKDVLYVETDYKRPGFAVSTGLSHDQKNMLKLIEKNNNYDIMDFIANKRDVLDSNKNMNKAIAEKIQSYPETFYFLAFPKDFNYTQMPEVEQKEEFVHVFIESIKHTDFDYIIFNTANELSYMLSYPLIVEADILISIIGSSPVDAIKLKHELDWVNSTNLTLPNKFYTIFNFIDEDSSFLYELESILGQNAALTIPYDVERKEYEWSLKIGSPKINESVEILLQKIGIEVTPRNDKRGIFARFS